MGFVVEIFFTFIEILFSIFGNVVAVVVDSTTILFEDSVLVLSVLFDGSLNDRSFVSMLTTVILCGRLLLMPILLSV